MFMYQNNQPSNAPINQEDENSILDILPFLRHSWRMIAILGAIGLAIAQIQLAQISTAAKNTNLLGVNFIEHCMINVPKSFPASFVPRTISVYSLNGKENVISILVMLIKLIQPEGSPIFFTKRK
jgi:hypothetical protein